MSAQQILKQIPPGIEGLNSSETLFIVSYTFLLLYQNRSTLTVLLFMILKISNYYVVQPQFPNFYINERIQKNQIYSCMKCLSSVFQVKASYFSLLILLFTLTKPRSQAWTNLLHRTRFFECRKSKSASDGHLTGNVGFCYLTCGFNFKCISIKILRNLNVVEIFEIRCLSKKIFQA